MFKWLKKKFSPVPRTRYFIVAGREIEASSWARLVLDPDAHQWTYVSSPDVLRGYNIAPNQVIYTGSFYERNDLREIEWNARLASRLPLR